MAVDPDEIDRLAATVADLYREAETALARRISRRLARGMESPQWAERKLSAVRNLREAARAILAALQANGSRAIVEAARTAYRAGWRSALEELPERWFGESGIPEQAQQAAESVPGFAAMEALAESVHADVGKRSSNILRDVVDAYRSVITAASARTISGASTRREAAAAAWRRLVDRGLSSFVDKSGRRWQLSSYVEMATRTVAQRAAVSGQTDRLDAAGIPLVYVSDHAQECKLCRPYEGRILRITPGPTGEVQVDNELTGEPMTVDIVDTLAGAQAKGLQHPNCRHAVNAYLPGVTRLPEQPTEDPDGDEARQRQRQIERQIRHYKAREAAALSEEERKAAGQKKRAWQAEMRAHLADNPDLKRLRYRERIGAGNIATGSRRDDAAGDIAAQSETSLDGETTIAAPTVRSDQPADEQAETDDVDQLDILDQPAEPEPAPAELPDFTQWSTEQLEAGIADYADNDEALEAITSELDRRANVTQDSADEQPIPDFTEWSDDDLAAALGDYGDDPEALEQIMSELDRRAEAEPEPEPEPEVDPAEAERQRHRDKRARQKAERQEREMAEYDRLVAEGMDEAEAWAEATGQDIDRVRRDYAIYYLREQRYTGSGFDELARKAYKDYVDNQYWQAEADTNGYLLSNAGELHVENPRDLFTGPESRARKWASDELKQWWDRNGRMTFDEYAAMLLGDAQAAREAGERTGGEDFLQ